MSDRNCNCNCNTDDSSAVTEPDDSRVTEGAWAGFTRREARDWLRVLFDYEPHGFISPGSQVRIMATRRFEQGDLPEVFGYPARAAGLHANGLSPELYRLAKVLTGARRFSPSDVRSR